MGASSGGGEFGDGPVGEPVEPCSEPICDIAVPDAPESVLGTCDYYTWRHDNFLERHQGCIHKVPDYYLDYGYKYCVLFSTKTRPKLSAKGKAWLDCAKMLLQVYMEDGLCENPSIELNGASFRAFAFGTHPDAYWDAGLKEVGFKDKMKIMAAPDLKEWTNAETWDQFFELLSRNPF